LAWGADGKQFSGFSEYIREKSRNLAELFVVQLLAVEPFNYFVWQTTENIHNN
jgi:hypothetical protein